MNRSPERTAFQGATEVRRRAFFDWVVGKITDLCVAVWRGDLETISLLVAVAAAWALVLWFQWVRSRRRARRLGLPLDGSIPPDEWRPPSAEEVGRVLNERGPGPQDT